MTGQRSLRTNEAVIRDAKNGSWLYFSHPVEVMCIMDAQSVVHALCRMEKAVSEKGLYAVCMVSYEAASAFDAACAVKPPGEFPLVWYALYEKPRITQPYEFPLRVTGKAPAWEPSMTFDEYRHAFLRVRYHLERGDTYQVNLSLRLKSFFERDPWEIFVRLIARQGFTCGAYVVTDEWAVCSASPELFFMMEDDLIEAKPMKGTARRSPSVEEDLANAEKLVGSEKNRAENLMIVDMVRNDLGRVAFPGSVSVPSLFTLERYPTVWQLTSTVRARTNESLSGIMAAVFPSASITGAPKLRTMEIIRDLEKDPRSIYTGSVGFISPDSRAQFNVAIRTLCVHRATGDAFYGVGGGVVWDSTCEDEWDECMLKSRVLREAAEPFDLVETMLWTEGGGYFLLDLHLDRLAGSASYFGYRVDMKEVRERLNALSVSFTGKAARVRLLVSQEGTVRTQVSTLMPPEESRIQNICLAEYPIDRSNPFLYHKTTERRHFEDALGRSEGFDDVLFFNEEGFITESARANVIVDMGGTLSTPPVSCGLLGGTYREWMIRRSLVRERPITVGEILACERVFLINSVRGMYPVRISNRGPDTRAKAFSIARSSRIPAGF